MPFSKNSHFNVENLKIVIYCPHKNVWFKNPVKNILKRQKVPNKYSTLFNNLIESNHRIYITTKLYGDFGFIGFLKSIFDPVELFLWCFLNKISIKKIRFIFNKRGLLKKDVLLLMYYGALTHESDCLAKKGEKIAKLLSGLKIFKIVHMTHYIYNVDIGNRNLEILKPNLLVAENNLKNNSPFYKKYFSNIDSNFYQLSYTPSDKFTTKSTFLSRVNKMVVTGTITFDIKDERFIDFFKHNELQPLRRKIYQNSYQYPDQLECLISDLNESRIIAGADTKSHILKKIYSLFFSKHPQSKYFKRDIVEIYNSYRMFTVPEEICNLPAIAFVEGMACGCAYFGLDDPMYRDLGLIPGIHYVAYDGSEFDLIHKVQFYQSHPDELEKVANSGFEFVKNHLTPKIVFEKLISQIKADLTSGV
jgi:hypothetical protein